MKENSKNTEIPVPQDVSPDFCFSTNASEGENVASFRTPEHHPFMNDRTSEESIAIKTLLDTI